jgi:hypothetical protein
MRRSCFFLVVCPFLQVHLISFQYFPANFLHIYDKNGQAGVREVCDMNFCYEESQSDDL